MYRRYLLTSLFATAVLFAESIHDEPLVHEAHLPWYVIVKGAMITGNKINESDEILDGDRGYGYGIDLGYHLSRELAIEADFTYARNDVGVSDETEAFSDTYRYYSYAIDAVYTYEYDDRLGIFGKVGYEYEEESVRSSSRTNYGHGLVFGIGFEYHLLKSYKIVVEYEHSTVVGPHGEYLFFGVMYGFSLD